MNVNRCITVAKKNKDNEKNGSKRQGRLQYKHTHILIF